MTSFLGAPILVEPGEAARAMEVELAAQLTLRQRRALVGEVNAWMLAGGGRDVVLEVQLGQRSAVVGGVRFTGDAKGASVARRVQLPEDAEVRSSTLRQRLERRFPLTYDRVRAAAIALTGHTRIPANDGVAVRSRIAPPSHEKRDGPKAVLVGMHWLELGGAEAWALRTVGLVLEAGLTPIVVVDRLSDNPLLDDPMFADVMFVPVAEMGQADADEVLRGIVQRYDLRGVLVHHCHWLYDRLAWLADVRARVPVVDALHIVEDGPGGFPAVALREGERIQTHHVISPALRTWLVERGADEEAVHLAPLSQLTVGRAGRFRSRSSGEPFTIAFVGRLTRQKRPNIFVRLVHKLSRAGLPVRAIMHGDGELDAATRHDIRRARLTRLIEMRPHSRPVADTWAEADLLVVSSLNEGLTLTTFEAIAAGVPVVSADVGSQSTIVTGAALVPPAARAFLREATRTIMALAASEEARRTLWEDERRRMDAFAATEDATTWMRKVIAGWAE